MASKKKGLGKGLDALLGDAFSSAASSGAAKTGAAQEAVNKGGLAASPQTIDDLQKINIEPANAENRVLSVPLELCQRGKYQPRRAMDTESLEDLANSIKSQGVMQPIILRALQQVADGGEKYEIIAGERRWRACQLAGMDSVPAIVRDVPDEAAMAMALIENLQRDDLNPMDEAYALQRLQQEFELTHQQIAEAVGKSRTAVSNSMRLLALHKDVKLMLEHGDIEMGHARALLSIAQADQPEAAREVVNRVLTVRQTETLAKNWNQPKTDRQNQPQDANIRQLQTDLSERLGVPVVFKHKPNGGGQLILKYNNLDELDGLLEHIK